MKTSKILFGTAWSSNATRSANHLTPVNDLTNQNIGC